MPRGLALAVLAISIGAAVALRLLGQAVVGRHTRARQLVSDYALWSVLPFAFLVLLIFAGWAVALGFAVLAPLGVLIVERFYFARNPTAR